MSRRREGDRSSFDTLRRYCRMLAQPQAQKLLLALAARRQDAPSLADGLGTNAAWVRRRLLRLEAEGLAASTRIGRNRVFHLTDRASVTRQGGKLAIGLQAPDGTGVTVKSSSWRP